MFDPDIWPTLGFGMYLSVITEIKYSLWIFLRLVGSTTIHDSTINATSQAF
jgi:hypothetical protein